MTSDAPSAYLALSLYNPAETKQNLKAIAKFDGSVNRALSRLTKLLSQVDMPLFTKIMEDLRTLSYDLITILKAIVADCQAVYDATTPLVKGVSGDFGYDLVSVAQDLLQSTKKTASERRGPLNKINDRLSELTDKAEAIIKYKIKPELREHESHEKRLREELEANKITIGMILSLSFLKSTRKKQSNLQEVQAEQEKCRATLSVAEGLSTDLQIIWDDLGTGCKDWWQLLERRISQIVVVLEMLDDIEGDPVNTSWWLRAQARLISVRDAADELGRIVSESITGAPFLQEDPTFSSEIQLFEKGINDLPIALERLRTAEAILHHPNDLRKLMRLLTQHIHDELISIKVVFDAWTFHLEQGFPGTITATSAHDIAEMEPMNTIFFHSVAEFKKDIATIFNEDISRSKSKTVKSKQNQEISRGIAPTGIVTGEEAQEELTRLVTILTMIASFSTDFERALRGPEIDPEDVEAHPPKDVYSVKVELAQKALRSLNLQTGRLGNSIKLSA